MALRDITTAGHGWEGTRVLVRADLNVPLDGTRITDDTRIAASVPTIRALLEQGAAVAVCSHLGRPKGTVVAELSLAPCATRRRGLLARPEQLMSNCVEQYGATRKARLGPR